MENDEDDYEVFPANAPQTTYLESQGFSSSDFITASIGSEQAGSKSPKLAVESKSFIVLVGRIFTDLYVFFKEVIVPTAEYSRETELIKHCGLLFKENALLIEEFSPPLSKKSRRKCFYLKLFLHLNFSIVLPLTIAVSKSKKLASVPVVIFLSFTSMYSLAHLRTLYVQFNRRNSIENFVSSLKQFNQKFLKALQFISENNKSMMKNCSSLTKMEISGYNSYKVVDPSWLHFKSLVVELTVLLLKNFHSLCRVLNELPVLNEYYNYQSVCSVDFCDLGVSEVETDSHQAYISFLNKLKLLLFLIESELLSFIAINLSESHRSSSTKISYIFSSACSISKILIRSSDNIEHYFNRFYGSSEQELLLKKSKIVDTTDSDILNVFLETRALAHSSLSAAVQVRNLEKFLEKMIEAPQFKDKFDILLHTEENLFGIECELLSSQQKLKTLARHLYLAKKPTNDLANVEGVEANSVHDQDHGDILKTGIEVGQSDFNPTQPDEVFVGVSTDDTDKVNPGSNDDFSEEHFITEIYNRSSKNLIKELKGKLKDKKNEMVEREKIALQRQNISDLEEKDDLSFESSDEDCDQAKLENSDSLEDKFHKKVSFFGRVAPHNMDDCAFEKQENSESLVKDLNETTLLFESSPFEKEKSEAAIESSEVSVSERLSTIRSDHLIDSAETISNPLAMSVANISRMWNQELSRTEEYFGSDSEPSSDCDN